MRIIAGRLKSHVFDSPQSPATHPMSEKARGGLFNSLGDISGLKVLDAFGGSGGLSFEAISRGAASALVIENNKSAAAVIKNNIQKLGLPASVKLIQASASSWLKTSGAGEFDIILCDPPYDDLQLGLILKLTERLAKTGLMVLSCPGKIEPPQFQNLRIVAGNDYGDAQLIFYRR